MLGAVRTEAEDGCLDWGGTAMLWQQCSTLLQLGNAELVLSANGFRGCGVWVPVPRGGVVGPPVVLALWAAASSSCPLVSRSPLPFLASPLSGPLFPGYGSWLGVGVCIYFLGGAVDRCLCRFLKHSGLAYPTLP